MHNVDENPTSSNCLPLADRCVYTSCYCEENVWHLCDYVGKNFPHKLKNFFVIFISNEKRAVPLWCQKASLRDDGFVIWDYHVILVHEDAKNWVYDLDSVLSFPCEFTTYSANTFQSDQYLKQKFHRKFRVIEAEIYLKQFASDRSHMIQADSNKWMKPPPSYPCIRTSASNNNLPEFITMNPNARFGQVMTLDQLKQRFIPQIK